VIIIEFISKAGRWFEKQNGADYFAATLLNKGTRSKSSFEIANRFDSLGAFLEISPGQDVVSISLYCLGKTLQPSLDLLIELLTDSVFPEDELRQQKSIYLQNLKVNLEKTSFLASKYFRQQLFGKEHPYGKELEEADVNALLRPHLVDQYSILQNDMTVIASGLVTEENTRQVTTAFGGLTATPVTPTTYSIPKTKMERLVVAHEGRVQSSLRIGKRSIDRKHQDYAALLFLNHILGGYFGSRLMKNIREEKGLTYGIYSSLHNLQHASYLVMGADVNKENQEVTFDEIRKELIQLRTVPIPMEEIEVARNHFIGSLQSEITTPFAHADKLRTRVLFGLGENYYQQLINTIDRLTPDELMRVGNEFLNEDSFTEVAVG
jgi:predicted Zn-dependent peptidase